MPHETIFPLEFTLFFQQSLADLHDCLVGEAGTISDLSYSGYGWVLAFRAGARFGGFRKGKNAVRTFDLRDSDRLVLARCRSGNVTFWPPSAPGPVSHDSSGKKRDSGPLP